MVTGWWPGLALDTCGVVRGWWPGLALDTCGVVRGWWPGLAPDTCGEGVVGPQPGPGRDSS